MKSLLMSYDYIGVRLARFSFTGTACAAASFTSFPGRLSLNSGIMRRTLAQQQRQQQHSIHNMRSFIPVSLNKHVNTPNVRSSVQSQQLYMSSTDSKQNNDKTTTAVEISELKRLTEEATSMLQTNLQTAPSMTTLQNQISDLEQESSNPSFWDDPNSPRTKFVNQELSEKNKLLDRINLWDEWKGECDVCLELIDEVKDNPNERDTVVMMMEECASAANQLIEDGKRYELESLLNGKLDNKPARIILTAGAGGTEACDWVDMLHRMYLRHAENMGFTAKIEETSTGDVVGYKTMEILIEGPNAYGWFRGEKGAHRLVRLSPFNANNKRQTTFAGVDVVPFLDDEEVDDVDIPDSELEISTMRAGGKGGQNVNKVESGVRIKHIPTGINVKCTQERSQHQNKDIALKRVKAQLLAIAQEQKCEEIKAIRGDVVEAAWGAQIRNYVLQPYKMVKDQRSNWETSDAQGFLDGDLEACIGELLRTRVREEQEAKDERDANM
jgi:peptide chain release factor 2